MATSVSPGEPRLTGTSWSVRLGRARHGRSALEIYDGESLIDIVVPTPVAPELLRDARRRIPTSRRPLRDPNGWRPSPWRYS